MAISLNTLIENKIKGIASVNGYSNLISAGAVDILEKIKTYKSEDLQKFIVEENVHNASETIWTSHNATSVYAWEVMGAKRSVDISNNLMNDPGKRWKTANRLGLQDKSDFLNPKSLKYITGSYPGYIVEPYTNVDEDDGDNDTLAHYADNANYIITIFPHIERSRYHSWKIQYIPIPQYEGDTMTYFHSSYIPALAIYVAKNIVLNEMNRLLLLEEDLELASELKNHYALLEQEYAGLMNIPPKQEAK